MGKYFFVVWLTWPLKFPVSLSLRILYCTPFLHLLLLLNSHKHNIKWAYCCFAKTCMQPQWCQLKQVCLHQQSDAKIKNIYKHRAHPKQNVSLGFHTKFKSLPDWPNWLLASVIVLFPLATGGANIYKTKEERYHKLTAKDGTLHTSYFH